MRTTKITQADLRLFASLIFAGLLLLALVHPWGTAASGIILTVLAHAGKAEEDRVTGRKEIEQGWKPS